MSACIGMTAWCTIWFLARWDNAFHPTRCAVLSIPAAVLGRRGRDFLLHKFCFRNRIASNAINVLREASGRTVQRSISTRLGYISYPFAKDRWVNQASQCPHFLPRRMVQPGLATSGTNWDFCALYEPLSNDVIVNDDRNSCRWVWMPLVPNPDRNLFADLQVFFVNTIFQQWTIKITINWLDPVGFFQWFSFCKPRNWDKSYEIFADQWLPGSTIIPPGGITPAYPFRIYPARWNDYPTPYPAYP